MKHAIENILRVFLLWVSFQALGVGIVMLTMKENERKAITPDSYRRFITLTGVSAIFSVGAYPSTSKD